MIEIVISILAPVLLGIILWLLVGEIKKLKKRVKSLEENNNVFNTFTTDVGERLIVLNDKLAELKIKKVVNAARKKIQK